MVVIMDEYVNTGALRAMRQVQDSKLDVIIAGADPEKKSLYISGATSAAMESEAKLHAYLERVRVDLRQPPQTTKKEINRI